MTDPHLRHSAGYQLFMLLLCLYALTAVTAQSAFRLDRETMRVLDLVDYVVSALFLFDFVVSLKQAPNRWRYLVTWGWIDLLTSLPTFVMARWGRIGRAARAFRLVLTLRSMKFAFRLILEKRAQNAVYGASLMALFLVVSASIAVLQVEPAAGGNIRTAEDALWWALATITTVGYGDLYPVTGFGRVIAAVLMCAGVGLFGVFSGFLASWFLNPGEQPFHPAELSALRHEVAELRRAIESSRRPE